MCASDNINFAFKSQHTNSKNIPLKISVSKKLMLIISYRIGRSAVGVDAHVTRGETGLHRITL